MIGVWDMESGNRRGSASGRSVHWAHFVVLALAAVGFAAALAVGLPSAARAEAIDPSGPTVLDSVSDDGDASRDAPFGIDGFERNAKGTARAMEGQPEGYRYPLLPQSNLVLLRTSACVLVHVDGDAALAAGFDPADADRCEQLASMLCDLDEDNSMGGAPLSEAEVPWVVTTEDEYVQGDYRYRFIVPGSDGERYAVIDAAVRGGDGMAKDGESSDLDLGDGALWAIDARLLPADDLEAAVDAPWLEGIRAFFSNIDYRPLWVSIKTAGAALAVSGVLGLLAAWKTMGTSVRWKGALDSLFTIPMVLPPTVCGFLLLMLFGRSTWVGRWLIEHGISLVFTWQAAVISAVVVSFPLVYRTALGAFEALDSTMLDAARTLGWSEWRIFRSLMMPLSWPSIAAGVVLAFARAMGEFGCTLFFAGNYAGVTQTIPIAIYFEWMGGNTGVALFWVAVVIAFSFLVIVLINVYTSRSQAFRRSRPRLRRRPGAPGPGRELQVAAAFLDDDEAAGGDALRIDREALRGLLGCASSSEEGPCR